MADLADSARRTEPEHPHAAPVVSDQAGNLQGKRLFAGSDRDRGLWVFRHIGG